MKRVILSKGIIKIESFFNALTLNKMTSITTTDINEALAALRTGNCTGLNANDAGWGDTELFEIIKCIAIGLGSNLVSLELAGNNFSREGAIVLCAMIGPANVARATNNMQQLKVVNPQ